ncbi:MAG TPA: hypothetical protein VIL74_11195 [Pyrinomonadaceae bacterium]|jgi:hypothetical protein
MKTISRFGLAFMIAGALIFSGCSGLSENHEARAENITTGAGAIVSSEPVPDRLAKIAGQNQAITITSDLKTSVARQPLPVIWLEFEHENSEPVRVELDDKAKENLRFAGEALFNYKFVVDHSENPDERYEASYNQIKTYINALNEIRKLKMALPDGERKLTEAEIREIINVHSGLVNARYEELGRHFYPESALSEFKTSVNEKLGYRVF